MEAMSHTREKKKEPVKERLIDHSGIYKHIAGSRTQTRRCTASPSCWTALRRYSLSLTAPRWLELHCFSSWRKSCRDCFHSRIPLCFLTFFCCQNLSRLSAPPDFLFCLPACVSCPCLRALGRSAVVALMVKDDITACGDHRSGLSPEAALRWHLQVRLPPASSASGSAERFWCVLILLGHFQVASLVGFRILSTAI